MPIASLKSLIEFNQQNMSQFKGLSAAYSLLLGGVPNISGYTNLISANNDTNFGSKSIADPGPVFNDENIYINVMNALYQGNASAKSAFDSLAQGATLAQKLASVYNSVIPMSLQTAEGLAAFSAQASFYSTRAAELGISGDAGAALVAYASLIKIAVDNDYGGIGDGINDLRQAVLDGSATLPESGTVLTALETADGANFDGDDASSGGTGTGTTSLPSGVTSVLSNATSETFTIADNLTTRIDVGAAIENVSIVFTGGSAKSVIDPGGFYGSFVNVVATGQGSFKGNDAFIFGTRTDIYSSNLKSFDASGLDGRAKVDFISDKGMTVTGSAFADSFDFFSPTGASAENGDNRIVFNSSNKSTLSSTDIYSDFFQGGTGDKVDVTSFSVSTGKTAITTFAAKLTGGENFNGNAVGVSGESESYYYYVDTNSNGVFDVSNDLVFWAQDTTVMSADNFLL